MHISIPGNPIPKARHRSVVISGKIRNYDPKKLFVDATRRFLISSLGGEIVFRWKNTDSLQVFINFFMKIPSALPKWKKNEMEKEIIPHTRLPDLDNLVKMYLDCANGILFQDDRQIASLCCRKMYSSIPRTEIRISLFEPNKEKICQGGMNLKFIS